MRRGDLLPLVGRDEQLASALDVVDEVVAGSGRALVVEGEAGIGKTRLLDEVLDRASARGSTVVRARGGELETDLPFAPFVDAFRISPGATDQRRAAIAALLTGGSASSTPVDLRDDAAQRRLQVVQMILDVIEDLCADGPVAVALEDAHWVDEASLAVVDRLARRRNHLSLLVVVTARLYPRPAALHGVLDRLLGPGALHLRLEPLSDAAIDQIARLALGAEPGEELAAELAAAGGNPLFVTELLAALHEEGDLRRHEGRIDIHEARVPPSLALTVLRRLSVLPEDTVELVRMAAVLGTAFDPTALAAFVGRSVTEVVAGLEPARQAGVLGAASGRVAFRHDLVRDAVYDDLPEALRASLHAVAARALGEAGFPADRTAPHLLRASLTHDEATVRRLREVAAELGPRAPDLAVDLLGRAVELVPPTHQDLDELKVELVTALSWAERPGEAAALADALLTELPAGPLRRETLIVRALQTEFLGTDDWPRFAQPLEDAAAGTAPTERARLLAFASLARLHEGDLDRARTLGQQALETAEHAHDEFALLGSLVACMHVANQTFDDARAIALARRAAAVARRGTDPEFQRWSVLADLAFAAVIGNIPQHQDEAISVLRDTLARAEERGLAQSAVNVQLELGSALYRVGQWDEAAVELEAALERAHDLARPELAGLDAFGRLARIAVHRDDLAGARLWLDRADRALSGGGTNVGVEVRLAVARAELLAASGSEDIACDLLARTCTATPVASGMTYVLAPYLARLSVRLDRHRDVTRQALADLPADEIAAWVRGLLEADLEQLLAAVARVRERGTGLREEQPMLWEDAAELLVADGRVDDAVQLLTEAVEVWEELDAVRDVARVEARLRDLGVRRGRRGPRARPSVGWEALTETEQRVVELVAERLLYREIGERMFISRRTVETHISHVFAKIGVSNRRDLETAYAEWSRADLPAG